MDDLTTEHFFDSKTAWIIDVFGLFFDMLSMGVCTTRHWQTSGRLVQELNVCTVSQHKNAIQVSLCLGKTQRAMEAAPSNWVIAKPRQQSNMYGVNWTTTMSLMGNRSAMGIAPSKRAITEPRQHSNRYSVYRTTAMFPMYDRSALEASPNNWVIAKPCQHCDRWLCI